MTILNNGKILNEHPIYNKIYVNPDLTPEQLAENKKIREDLKLHRAQNPGKSFTIRNKTVTEREIEPHNINQQKSHNFDGSRENGTPLSNPDIQVRRKRSNAQVI
jgi:hypothetical protein